VRTLVRTEIGLVLVFAVSVLVSYVGLAVVISGDNQLAGTVVLVLGLWSVFAAPVVHDRLHRERGEASHAVWGRNDRRNPPWWPAR